MSESLFSQSWYRVASLKPRLRSHVKIYRHNYRGEDWFVIQDRFTGRHHRFSPEAFQIIGLLDGKRSLDLIWKTACGRLDVHMPTQDEVIGLLARLSASDLLQTSVLPDFSELQQRQDKGRRQRLWASVRSPVFLRIPLLDPDRFLSATIGYIAPFISRTALLVWFLVVGGALLMAITHWPDLTNSVTDQILKLENLVLMSLIYPILKAIHEFAHAYTVKKWGGEVHEMGIMLLVFMPIPYLDASSSLAFQQKSRRIAVAASGILAEVFIAALALAVWLNVEAGAVRAAAFNTMLIAGISTLLFNGNPLLRFDAYYILADFLEIPNLGQRANRYIGYLVQRYYLGVDGLDSPTNSTKEAGWLLFYGIASFCYRIFISIRIILFVATKFFFIGIIFAVWVGSTLVIMPLGKTLRFLFNDREMKKKRTRIVTTVFIPLVIILAALFLIPVRHQTVCEGVIWVAEDARVHPKTDGFVSEILTGDKSEVTSGTRLIRLEAPELMTRVRFLQSQKKEYQARYNVSLTTNRTDSLLLKEELGRIEAEIDDALQRQQELLVKSPVDGQFVLPGQVDLPGMYFHRGDTIGYVLKPEDMQIRVVVPQARIDEIRGDTQSVSVRVSQDMNRIVPAVIVREIPAASNELPSLALSLEGGGNYALDPREPLYPKVFERIFQFQIRTDEPIPAMIEERVYVRFKHSPEPLPFRWYRSIRRLLLKRFAV